MSNEIDELEKELRKSLSKHDYESFIKTITKITINNENYKLYLDKIENILTDQMKEEVYAEPAKDSSVRLLEILQSNYEFLQDFSVNEDKKPFLQRITDLKAAIVKIFKIKLNMRDKEEIIFSDYEKDIKNDLDNFEGRFMK